MTLYDLWFVSPRSHVFIFVDGGWVEYTGGRQYAYWYVEDVEAGSGPTYRSYLRVKIRKA
jgi:hypothetical protein